MRGPTSTRSVRCSTRSLPVVRPFEGDIARLMLSITREDPEPVTSLRNDLPPEIDQIIGWAPRERPRWALQERARVRSFAPALRTARGARSHRAHRAPRPSAKARAAIEHGAAAANGACLVARCARLPRGPRWALLDGRAGRDVERGARRRRGRKRRRANRVAQQREPGHAHAQGVRCEGGDLDPAAPAFDSSVALASRCGAASPDSACRGELAPRRAPLRPTRSPVSRFPATTRCPLPRLRRATRARRTRSRVRRSRNELRRRSAVPTRASSGVRSPRWR